MSFANLHKALLKIIKKNKKCKNENMQTANLQVKRGLTFERKIQKGRRRNMCIYGTMHVTDMKREKKKKWRWALWAGWKAENKSEIQENACSCSCRTIGPKDAKGQRTKATLHFCLSSRALNKL